MKSLKRISVLSLSGIVLLALGACQGGNQGGQEDDGYVVPEITADYAREDDGDIYENALGQFNYYAGLAKGIDDDDERFLRYAEAEAALLNSGAFIPTTTQGGNYAITRVAPRTIPYAKWGNDEDRLKSMVLVDAPNAFIKKEERAEMIEAWKTAREGGAAYDPKGYLQGKGYTLASKYQTTYNTAPVTLDILNTSEAADTEVLVNAIDGLLEYDNLGQLRGNLAVEDAVTGLPYSLSEDKLTYTFTIVEGAKWVTANGDVYADVKADDFVAGFQHMLDASAGLEWLVEGVVEGVSEYLAGSGDFDDVGVKAPNDRTFEITLAAPESFFPTRLTYSCFMPMNRQFFLTKGGAFGVSAFKEAKEADGYSYGVVSDASNMVYNGAFIPGAIVEKSEITLKANDNYFKKSLNNFSEIKWVYDDGQNPDAIYSAAVSGTYAGVGLGVASGLLKKAQSDGNFDKYAYVADTTTVTYMAGFNTNRGTFETGSVVSTQSNAEKTFTHYAMQNIFFRKALQFGWDRKKYNAVSVGDELAALSLRNMYTDPNFLSLSKDVVDVYGHKFEQGSTYGDLVQYYCDKIGLPINVQDSQDGWFNPDLAKGYMQRAVAQLKAENKWGGKIKLDITYYSGSAANTAQANAVKALFEEVLGDYVEICLNAAETTADYYACGYRASNGEAGNFDIFYGSGWGPDYGDPSTYLDTWLPDGAGYMTKIAGLF